MSGWHIKRQTVINTDEAGPKQGHAWLNKVEERDPTEDIVRWSRTQTRPVDMHIWIRMSSTEDGYRWSWTKTWPVDMHSWIRTSDKSPTGARWWTKMVVGALRLCSQSRSAAIMVTLNPSGPHSISPWVLRNFQVSYSVLLPPQTHPKFYVAPAMPARCKYTTSVDIQKTRYKASHSCRTTCERSESAQESGE